MCNLKSDIGAKAAWKGFSSQTTYIAHRLMNLGEDYDFYPEKVEDLMIKKGNSIIELVQIKNLSSDLALSSFSPKDSDSFFRRALKSRKENENIILTVISFGNIGQELQGLIKKNESQIKSIKSKLLGFDYSNDEIEWILSNLSIIQVDEENLKNDIFKKLEEKIETMAAPQIAFDTLICYVSDLSRYAKHTSKEKWDNRIDDFVKDISSINGLCAQYGKTIIKLTDYKTQKTDEDLIKEYRMGVNAHPQHIRNSLDIVRRDWLYKIQDCFKNNNIVVVKGVSGQGKSSLAYRYLIDNYIENYVFVIEKLTDSKQAIDIVTALSGLSINKSGDIAVYLDVSPYDTEWLWIAEEINKRGMKLKLLITIREEDFNRSDIDSNIFNSNIIEISFNKLEAEEIFNVYDTPYFLNFEQAWEKFGETGPFMEFMYLLNQSDTLKNKLESQINRIITNEVNADRWLDILQVICYVGRNNLKINLQRLIEKLPCNQSRKMLQEFEKEYLVKISNDYQYVECLHAVRAEILYSIISKNSIMNEERTLLYSISVVDEFFQVLLVKYFYNNRITDSFIKKITEDEYLSWTAYASVLSALLWLDLYRLYTNNKRVYKEANKLFGGNFVMFTGDATGYIEFDSSRIVNSFGTINPRLAQKMLELINALPQNKVDYLLTDMFINNIKEKVNNCNISSNDNLSEVGFVLFWLAQRNIFIDSILCKDVITNIDNYSIDNILDFLVGIQMQNKIEIYESVAKYLMPEICKKYNIIRLEIDEKYIEADFIQNAFKGNEEENHIEMNEIVMDIICIMRRLFYNKQRYRVKALGTNLMQGIQTPDTEKNIESKNLPLIWIVQINGWLIKIDDYEKRTENWSDFKELIDNDRKSIIYFSKLMCNGIEYFYKKGGNIEKFISQEYKKGNQDVATISTRTYRTPKCVNDIYGLNVSKNKVKLIDSMQNTNQQKGNKDITSFMNSYKMSFTNFINQKDDLILSRYKQEEINENARLSLINIVGAISDLSEMQSKYAETFSKTSSYINFKEEYEQLLLLAVMWRYLYNNKVRKENSLVYECKETIKQTRKKIKNFFDKIFEKYTVQKFNAIDDKLYISLDLALVDDFCERLFSQFKNEFPEMKNLSVDSLFMNEYAQKIIITIPLYEDIIIGGFKIELKNLIVCEEIEKFMIYRQPLDKNEIDEINNHPVDENNTLYNAYRVIGNLSALPLFYNHTTSVMKYIKSYSKGILIQDDVFFNWCDDGAKFHCSVIEDIINSFKKLNDVIPEELYETYQIIMALLNDYKEASLDIVKVDDIGQMNEVMGKINESIISFFDKCNFA
ncbi:hypothetical protein [Clostridium beijerinckii]|uniref:hypothetical protein n=1 Tax=Clostridium beijerinckii TaxID=1520 RepID=UPI00047C4772|nr:hypothetical protein [Clostridium beijerinckii]